MKSLRPTTIWLPCLFFLGLATTAQAATLTLAWDPNPETDLAGYVLCYGTQVGNCTTSIDVGNTSSRQLTNLVDGTRYYFVIKAYNTSGIYSAASQEVSGVASVTIPTSAPTAPAGPTPANGATGVSLTTALSWAASTNATQYDVAFGPTNPPAVVSSNQTATTYQPVPLTASTTYYWRIVAKGAGGSTSGPVWSLTTGVYARPAPVAAYGFDEGTGTTAGDASGAGHNGALTNATWTTAGKYGGALAFNGNSSRVTVADAGALHLSNGMTLEAWVNPSGTGVGYWEAIVYKGGDNYFLATTPALPTSGGTLGAGLAQATSPNVLALNTWTHLATTYDGSTMRLFVNGSQVASQPASGLFAVSTNPLEIGGSLVDAGPFAGLIDDIRIYNTALTTVQIQADMTTPVANPRDTQPPTAPTSLVVTAVSSAQVTLTWTPSTDNVGVTGYRIERCQAVGCTTFGQVGTATTTSYSEAGLAASTSYTYRVRATDAASNLSSYSSLASATTPTPTPAPTAPAGPTPANGATGVSLTTALSWAASTNATQYDVAFGPTNPPAVVSSNQTATAYQPVALTAGTTYYWRIVAKGAGGSTSGPVWSLTTGVYARPAPVAAYGFDEGTGTTAGDASGAGHNGALTNATWTTAGKYGGALAFNGNSSRVTVADAGALHLSNGMTLEAWVNPSGTGVGYWEAIVYKGGDNYFLATTPALPTSGGTLGAGLAQATSPNVLALNTWTHLATTYDGSTMRLFVNGSQVASQPASGLFAVSTNPLEIGGSLVDAGPFAGLIDDIRIYNTALTTVQIQADMTTPVANPRDTQPPTAPTSLVVTAVSSAQVTLTWTPSTDNVGVTGYRIERCQAVGCTTFGQVGTATTTSYSEAGLAASTSYTYRVRATDAASNLSSYSSLASATTPTPTPAPTAPAGPTPANGATGVSLTTALSWAASTNATQYDVAFGPTNPPAVVSSNQTATTYQPVALTASTTYYWRIVAKGAGGSTSGPVWSFTTLPPAPMVPSGPQPLNGETNVLATIALNWAASTNATQYDLAFGMTNPPPTVATNQATTGYQAAMLLGYSATYFWRVTAKGAGGTTPGPVWSFTTQQADELGNAPAPPSPSSDLQPLRLMTWNVNGGNDRDGAPNVDAQVTLMASSGAHVIALQGVTITTGGDLSSLYRSKLEAATSRTWNALWIPDPRPAPANPEGNLLLTTLSILSSATTQFDTGPINRERLDAKRSAGWIGVAFGNVTVHIATTQLAVDATDRQAQLVHLQGWIASVPMPRLIGGDFNMLPTDATYTQMTSGFADTWTALVQTGDAGITQDLSPSHLGRLDYWWYELTDPRAIPNAIWVVKTECSSHHAVVIDVNVR